MESMNIASHLSNREIYNYWSYGSKDRLLYIVLAVCMPIVSLFLLIRIYTQLCVVGKFEVEDYCLCLGYLIAISTVIVGSIALIHGWGTHEGRLAEGQSEQVFLYITILEVLYGPMIFCIKLAIVLRYLRIFAPDKVVNPFVYHGSWLIISACAIFYTITTILYLLECVATRVPRSLAQPRVDLRGVVMSTAIFNTFSDLAIFLLPVRTVWSLQISTNRKIAISFVFSMALSACVAAAMRAYYTMPLLEDKAPDNSYESAPATVCAYIEVTLGFVVACAISVPKLVQEKGRKVQLLFSNLGKKLGSRDKITGVSVQLDPPALTLEGRSLEVEQAV